jgi:hypothetical protein
MADRLHASATSDRKLRTILLFRQPVATGLRSGRKSVKPDLDVRIDGECRWSKASAPTRPSNFETTAKREVAMELMS